MKIIVVEDFEMHRYVAYQLNNQGQVVKTLIIPFD